MIYTDALRFPQRRFKPHRHVTKLPRLGLQRSQELSGDTPPAPRRLHEHPRDFPDTRFQFTNRSATDCFAIGVGDKKSQARISDLFWTKAGPRDAWVSGNQAIID